MFCPRCGQEQVSGDLRFCSNCGLPLGLVSQIIAHGGTLPQLIELAKKNKIFTRRNGFIASLFWFLFFVLILTPFWAILDVEEMAAMSGVIGVFGSIMIFLFSLFFLGKPNISADEIMIQSQDAAPAHVAGQQTQQAALPPQQTQSAQSYASPAEGTFKRYDTEDLVQPGSVTERTTKLLKEEEQDQ